MMTEYKITDDVTLKDAICYAIEIYDPSILDDDSYIDAIIDSTISKKSIY